MMEHNLNTKSRQCAGLGTAPEGIKPNFVLEPGTREDGQDLPFIDVTKISDSTKEVGNKEFDHPGPTRLMMSPMEREHTSKTR
jgi:hypothetical protein